MIDNASIESLKNSIDIVDVIGNFIELKKSGANYKANCPFHGEKTPSFVVSPSKQIFHCFGCGVGGDAIKFVMELEKLTYPESIEKIASMFNFSLQYTKGSSDYTESKQLLERIQQWYVKNLDSHQEAKGYLQSRGVSLASIERFGIGYVPQGKEVLQFLEQTHQPLPKALEAGVLARGDDGRYYARLVERITFPIFASSGAPVGFGGRTITNHPAKYINSPQTKLFNKSRLLYGYHLAKERIYQQKRLIVCEGYLDVVLFHQAGFTEAVASMGTALTPEHLPLLRKGAPEIILAYDGDNAGKNAALKAAEMLSLNSFEGGVVLFPNGQDPADLIASGKSEVVANLLRDAKAFIPFVLEQFVASYDLSNPHAKEQAFGQCKAFLSKLSPIIQESYFPLAGSLLGVSSALFSQGRGSGRTQQKVEPRVEHFQAQKDIAKLSLLKSLIENPFYIDTILEVVDASLFGHYRPLFEAILAGEMEHPQVMGLLLDESIEPLSEESFRATLCAMLMKYYEQKLKAVISNETMPFAQKSFFIRKMKTDIIPRLKRGELVAYDAK